MIKDLGSMAPLFIALEQGSINAIIWGIAITKERLDRVSFVRYQGDNTTSYPLIFWKKIPTGVTSLNDMQGMTICVEPASSQDNALNCYTGIIKKSVEKVDDALLNIQYGKADAALVEQSIAKKFKTKYPEIVSLDIPLTPELQEFGMGIAIKKNNNELKQRVETAIIELTKDGIIEALAKKWGIE